MLRLAATPTPDDLTALADKYARLAALREARDLPGGPPTDVPPRATLRALSQAFPGCLRELDTLGLAELRRRAERARTAADGGPLEPWMAWVVAFHRLLAAALAVKRAGVPPEDHVGPLPADLRAAIHRPPGGRLTPLVLAAVATAFGVPVATVSETLLPQRRRP